MHAWVLISLHGVERVTDRGSPLGVEEGVAWIPPYRALVESVLLYNCGTWALSPNLRSALDRLDRAQRKMLRKVMHWTDFEAQSYE